LIFTNKANGSIENRYIPGSGVGARSRFVRKALSKKAKSKKECQDKNINLQNINLQNINLQQIINSMYD
jgi:penicillin V acylase-like amidase (Ntn superfamily)